MGSNKKKKKKKTYEIVQRGWRGSWDEYNCQQLNLVCCPIKWLHNAELVSSWEKGNRNGQIDFETDDREGEWKRRHEKRWCVCVCVCVCVWVCVLCTCMHAHGCRHTRQKKKEAAFEFHDRSNFLQEKLYGSQQKYRRRNWTERKPRH